MPKRCCHYEGCLWHSACVFCLCYCIWIVQINMKLKGRQGRRWGGCNCGVGRVEGLANITLGKECQCPLICLARNRIGMTQAWTVWRSWRTRISSLDMSSSVLKLSQTQGSHGRGCWYTSVSKCQKILWFTNADTCSSFWCHFVGGYPSQFISRKNIKFFVCSSELFVKNFFNFKLVNKFLAFEARSICQFFFLFTS